VNPNEWCERVPLTDLITEATGCQTVVENDAAAYAVYEQRRGIGIEADSFAVVLIRDGVGGGIVLNGQVAPIPFEVGHIVVEPEGRKCSCGNYGCIESIAGRRAIRAIIGDQIGGPTEPDGIEQAIELARTNSAALDAFHTGGQAIARGVASIITLFGVRHVVIYCDPAMAAMAAEDDGQPAAATAFFQGVATFKKHVFPPLQDGCRVLTKPWRSTDGAVGAAFVALNRIFFIQVGD
jgi:predicted NBD/HSP70 family sugar kinase